MRICAHLPPISFFHVHTYNFTIEIVFSLPFTAILSPCFMSGKIFFPWILRVAERKPRRMETIFRLLLRCRKTCYSPSISFVLITYSWCTYWWVLVWVCTKKWIELFYPAEVRTKPAFFFMGFDIRPALFKAGDVDVPPLMPWQLSRGYFSGWFDHLHLKSVFGIISVGEIEGIFILKCVKCFAGFVFFQTFDHLIREDVPEKIPRFSDMCIQQLFRDISCKYR